MDNVVDRKYLVSLEDVLVMDAYNAGRYITLRQMRMFLDEDVYGPSTVKTINGSQGLQNLIVFLSLVPANRNNPAAIGFLSSKHRLNVALTRAKDVLVVVGNLDLWMQEGVELHRVNPELVLFIRDCRERGDIYDMPSWMFPDKLPSDKSESRKDPMFWTMLSVTHQQPTVRKRKYGSITTADNIRELETDLSETLKKLRDMAEDNMAKAKETVATYFADNAMYDF
jgi:hypothetical protein